MDYFDRLKQRRRTQESTTRAKGRRPLQRKIIRDIVPPEGREEIILPSRQREFPPLAQDAALPAPGPARHSESHPRQETYPQKLLKEIEKQSIPSPLARETLTTPPRADDGREKVPEPLAEEDLKIFSWEPEASRRTRLYRRILLGSVVGLIILGLIVPTFIVPKFSITIHPKIKTMPLPRTEFFADTHITASDIQAKKIPALAITVEKTLDEEREATGKKFIQERARGVITLANAFSSSPQTLVVNTRIQDAAGNVFRLTTNVTIPGAQVVAGKTSPATIAAEVIADRVGAQYNIAPTEFRIPGFRGTPKYDGFSARSEKSFSGGFEGQSRIVTSDDIKSASEAVTRRLVEALRDELKNKIPAGEEFLVPEGARQTTILKVTAPRSGDRLDRFGVSANGEGKLMAIRRSHLGEIIAANFITETVRRSLRIPLLQNDLTIDEARYIPQSSEIAFMVSGNLRYYQEPDSRALEEIIRSSTPKKSEAYLRGRDEIESFRIKAFPSWLWYIPQRGNGLVITVEKPE